MCLLFLPCGNNTHGINNIVFTSEDVNSPNNHASQPVDPKYPI